MNEELRGTTPKTIHLTLFATAVTASIGPGSIVSNDSYSNFPMIQIVNMNNAKNTRI